MTAKLAFLSKITLQAGMFFLKVVKVAQGEFYAHSPAACLNTNAAS